MPDSISVSCLLAGVLGLQVGAYYETSLIKRQRNTQLLGAL